MNDDFLKLRALNERAARLESRRNIPPLWLRLLVAIGLGMVVACVASQIDSCQRAEDRQKHAVVASPVVPAPKQQVVWPVNRYGDRYSTEPAVVVWVGQEQQKSYIAVECSHHLRFAFPCVSYSVGNTIILFVDPRTEKHYLASELRYPALEDQ